MNDQTYLQTSPKIYGTLLATAVISYASWLAIEHILFKDTNSPASNSKSQAKLITSMFRSWFSSTPAKFLQDSDKQYEVPLIEREEVSHDTRRFRFGLTNKNQVLGLPIGKHVHLFATINGEEVKRAYTPVSSDDDKGYVEFVIKVYFKNVHPRFPDGGKMSQHLESLKLGDTIKIRGPSGRLEYHGKGNLQIKETPSSPVKERHVKRLSMIAGGTGIAPMLQLIRDVLKKSDIDKTKMSLLFANQSEKDILLRQELETEAARHPDQLKIWYTVDRAEEGWKYSTGFVSKEMIKDHLYSPDEETFILMCGPPPMIKHVNSQLDELGWPMENRFKY